MNCYEKFFFNVFLVSLVLSVCPEHTLHKPSSLGVGVLYIPSAWSSSDPISHLGVSESSAAVLLFLPISLLGEVPALFSLSILDPVSNFSLKGMIIEGTVISHQRSLWEKVRKNRLVLGLCGEIVESEN